MKFKLDITDYDSGWIVRNAMMFCDWTVWFEDKEDAMDFIVALAKETFPE